MKKNWLSFVMVILILGIMSMGGGGCTSEPEESEKFVPDFELKNLSAPAQYKVSVTNVLFEKDKTYVVTLAVTNLDPALVGGFFGGVLTYEPGEDEDAVRVCTWAHSSTGAIVSGEKSYKWEFEATASTPSEMRDKQYFELMAQTSGYKDFKETDVFGIKGSITVKEKSDIIESDYDIETLTTTPGQNTVVSIQADEFGKVSAVKDKEGSFLRLYITTTTIGNTVGKIGPDQNWNTTQDDHIPLSVNASKYVDIELEELFKINGTYNYININIWDGTLTKVELWVPKG